MYFIKWKIILHKRFNEIDKHFSNVELQINDVKNTAQNNLTLLNF